MNDFRLVFSTLILLVISGGCREQQQASRPLIRAQKGKSATLEDIVRPFGDNVTVSSESLALTCYADEADELVARLVLKGAKVHELSFIQCGLTDRGLSNLSRLGGLRSVEFNGTRVSQEGFRLLARVPGLREAIIDFDMHDAGLLEFVERQPELVKLSIQNGVTDEQLKMIGQLSKLRSLTILESELASLRSLSRLKSLEFLRVYDCQFDSLAGIEELPLLHDLELPGSILLSERWGESLAECHQLRSLDLRELDLHDSDLIFLAKLPKLESLWVNETGVTVDGLREFLDHCEHLKELSADLDDREITDLKTGRNVKIVP